MLKWCQLTYKLFFCVTSSVSWVDVAAVCTPHHQCHSVCGGVCQTHCWLHGPLPEWSDYIAESRSVHSPKMLTSQIYNEKYLNSSKASRVWTLLTSAPSCVFLSPTLYLCLIFSVSLWISMFIFWLLKCLIYSVNQCGFKLFTFCCVVLFCACWSILAPLCPAPPPLPLLSPSLHLPIFLPLSVATLSGCLEVLLIRMCRAFNVNNSTIFFNGKFAPAQFFKALGEDQMGMQLFEL